MAEEFGQAEMTVHINAHQEVEISAPDPVTADEAMEGLGVEQQPPAPSAPQPGGGTVDVTPPAPQPGGADAAAVSPLVNTANEQARLLAEWEDLAQTRKQIGKAMRGDDMAMQLLYSDPNLRRFTADLPGGAAELDERINQIKSELGIAITDDAQIDKVAERHADAIGRMAIQRGAGAVEGLFGIPGLGAIAGAASAGGIMGIAGAALAAATLGVGMVVDWGKESINLDEQLAVAFARETGNATAYSIKGEVERPTLEKHGENIGLDAVTLLGRANQLQAQLGISREEAINRVVGGQSALMGYGYDASALMGVAGIDAGGGLAAGIIEGAGNARLGNMAGVALQQDAAMAAQLSHQLMRPLTGGQMDALAAFTLDAGRFGGPAAAGQSAELFRTLTAMASSGGGTAKQAFLARVFAKMPGPKDPQSFMDFTAPGNLHPGSPGHMAVVAELKEMYGDNWRMAAVELGFATDTLHARTMEWGGGDHAAAIYDTSDADAVNAAAAQMGLTASGRITMDNAEKQAEKQIAGVTWPSETSARIRKNFTTGLAASGGDLRYGVGFAMIDEMMQLVPENWIPGHSALDVTPPPPVSAAPQFRLWNWMRNWGQDSSGPEPSASATVTNQSSGLALTIIAHDASSGQASGPPTIGGGRPTYRPKLGQ